MSKISKRKVVTLVVALLVSVSVICWALFKDIFPFFLPWQTYESKDGYSISFPKSWYLNSEDPLMISDMEKRGKQTPIISIYTHIFDNSTLEEEVRLTVKGYDYVKDLGHPNQALRTDGITVDGHRAVLIEEYPQFEQLGTESAIVHLNLLIEIKDGNVLDVNLQFIRHEVVLRERSFYDWAINKVLTSIRFE